MKKLFLFAAMLTIVVASAFGAGVNGLVPQKVLLSDMSVVANDDDDVDLYLDCFENAVKSKDMELAAKIANILYGMYMTDAQEKRFTKIENKISKKDYRIYRDNLRFFASKPAPAQDGYDDFYVEPYADDNTYDDGTTNVTIPSMVVECSMCLSMPSITLCLVTTVPKCRESRLPTRRKSILCSTSTKNMSIWQSEPYAMSCAATRLQ